MTKKKDGVASVLAFEKKLVFSDGYMYGTTWEERESKASPIKLMEKAVRGTISNRLKKAITDDPVKLNAEVEKANLQLVDAAALDLAQDTLKLVFTLKILPGIEFPSACNDKTHQENIYKMVISYIENYGFDILAKRYAINIANARFLWRNRVGAEKIETCIRVLNNSSQEWKFDSYNFQLNDFDYTDSNLSELAEIIAKTLSGKNETVLLEVTSYAKVGKGQEIYPSEELVLDKGRGRKSKILYSIDGIAAMHSQKLGNAVRTIDTWYPECESNEGRAIAVETYGAVTNLGCAYRRTSDKKDFYTLFDKWSTGGELAEEADKHYVMAILVRGGVFGQSEKE
jgi:CRISPR-associated protein Csy3